jgi:hypothetical protein
MLAASSSLHDRSGLPDALAVTEAIEPNWVEFLLH